MPRDNDQPSLLLICSASTVVRPHFNSCVFSFASAKCCLASPLTLCALSAKNTILGSSRGGEPAPLQPSFFSSDMVVGRRLGCRQVRKDMSDMSIFYAKHVLTTSSPTLRDY